VAEDNEEKGRRLRLHELDQLLDGLERLNLQEAREMPEALREGLGRFGVEVPPKANFTQLIEQVWELQEQFLNPSQGVETGSGQPLRVHEGR
jgi:hypothetical protein